MRKSILFAATVAAMTILGAAISAEAAPVNPASAAVQADAAIHTETVAHHGRHHMRRHHRMERRHMRHHHRMDRHHYRSHRAHQPRMRHHRH